MADGRSAIAFATPAGPSQDLGGVPHPDVQQMHQQGPHFGDGHLGLFFPPTAVSAAPRIPTPGVTGPYDDATRPSRASRIRPGHTRPSPPGCLLRSSNATPGLAPAWPTPVPPARWN